MEPFPSENLPFELLWMLLAPTFSKFQSKLSLHSNAILSFTGAATLGDAGAFNEVHEVIIHRAHRKHISALHGTDVALD